jgi:hypothetical protein
MTGMKQPLKEQRVACKRLFNNKRAGQQSLQYKIN